jgi:hypothetical protein
VFQKWCYVVRCIFLTKMLVQWYITNVCNNLKIIKNTYKGPPPDTHTNRQILSLAHTCIQEYIYREKETEREINNIITRNEKNEK